MKTLADRDCASCRGEVPPLQPERKLALARELNHGWRVVRDHHLQKEFEFEDFKQALGFTNAVGELAEEAGHHPDIYLAWGKVRITLWTHQTDSLSETDFILAAKIQRLFDGAPVRGNPRE